MKNYELNNSLLEKIREAKNLSFKSYADQDIWLNQLRELFSKGADVAVKNENGATLLHLAVELDSNFCIKILKILNEYDIDPNLTDNDGNTALFYFASENYQYNYDVDETAEALIDFGVDPNIKNKENLTVLEYLHRYQDSVEHVEDILEAFIEVGMADNCLSEEFLRAVQLHNEIGGRSIVEMLLEKGVDINTTNEKQQTALHLCVMRNADQHTSVGGLIRLFLDKGINVNAQDKNGNTALHVATNPLNDYIYILKANPDIKLKNKEGISVFDVLKNAGFYDAEKDDSVYKECKQLIDMLLTTTETVLPSFTWNGVNALTHKPNTNLELKGSLKIPHDVEHLYYIGDNLVCAHHELYGLSCVDVTTGDILWTRNSELFGCWILENDILYFGTRTHAKVTYDAVEVRTGKQLWSFYVVNSYYFRWPKNGAYDLGDSIFIPENGTVISKKTGKKIRKFKIADYNQSVEPLINGNMYVVHSSKKKTMGFYCYDVTTGEFIKHIPTQKGIADMMERVPFFMLGNKCWYMADKCELCSVDLITDEYNEYTVDVPEDFYIYSYTITDINNILKIDIDTNPSSSIRICNCEFDLNTNQFTNIVLLPYDKEYFLTRYEETQRTKKLRWEDCSRILFINNKRFELPNYRGDDRVKDAVALKNEVFVVSQKKGIEYGTEDISLLHLIY